MVYRRENTRHGGPVEGGSIQLKIPVFPRYIYSLESAGFEGGRIVALTTAQGTTYKSHFHVTDHLGSVRVVVDEDRNVLERSDYLPYGKRCSGGELSDNRYRYNGKEEQAFVDNPYLDYGARMYDPDNRLSWTTPDPLAEKYYSISPYAFCAGNPINFIDPNGMDIWGLDNRGYVFRMEKSDEHILFALDKKKKKKKDEFIKFSDESILKSLSEQGFAIGNPTELASLFLFASDNTSVEWRFSRFDNGNGDQYAVGSKFDDDKAIRPEDMGYARENEIASIHSHPGEFKRVTGPMSEHGSMGWWPDGNLLGDSRNVSQNSAIYPGNQNLYVYFPFSGNIHHVRGAAQPALIRNIKNHKYDGRRLFWGTLNAR